MQDVLEREADRAMHLMRDGAALFGRLRAADFGRGRLEKDRVVEYEGVGEACPPRNSPQPAPPPNSPASLARLCCTAWNFEIFFSNATRSLE